jgi:membrane protease YdiL (CAAX protease family)
VRAFDHHFWQLVLALVVGLYYAAVYHRTRSLLNRILAHNVSDGTLWGQEYLLVWLKA